jgi:prophage regulatory protein
VPRASNSNALVCQTSITTSIGAKGLSAPLSNHSPPKTLAELADRRGRSGASLPDVTVFVGSSRQPLLGAARVLMAIGSSPDPLAELKSRQLELTGSVKPDGRARGTIRILVESVDRRGRSSASLPDGTVLVGSYGVLPATGYVRQSQVLAIFPFSPSTLWRKVKQKTFPEPIKLAPRITAWHVEDIREMLDRGFWNSNLPQSRRPNPCTSERASSRQTTKCEDPNIPSSTLSSTDRENGGRPAQANSADPANCRLSSSKVRAR